MKHCTKYNRQYDDPSLKFCTEDGTPLTPQFDSEAETVKIPDWTQADIIMEIADYLTRLQLRVNEPRLIRFEDLKSTGLTVKQVSENLPAAVRQIEYELLDHTDTRATVRRSPPAIVGSTWVRTTPVW